MFTPPEITTVRFTEDENATQSAIAAAAKALISSRRTNPQLRIVLAGDSLPAKTIAALISALRKLREVGGAIELRAENKAVRQIILRHGLERIFVFAPLPSAPSRHSRGAVAGALARAIAEFRTLMGESPAHSHKQLWMIW